MIELSARPASGSQRLLKIFGIGGAGANALDRLTLDGANPSHLVAINSDAPALTASVARERLQIGSAATRGLGCGGDPDLGRASVEEAARELRAAVDGLHCVFLLAGLGGGTGSGATPLIAELAREAGALVVAVVTLPFAFEGKRRVQQAAEALAALQQHADAVICFENDRMADVVSPNAGVQQAFSAIDRILSQSVRAVVALLKSGGPINLGFDDLLAALRPPGGVGSRCLFGFGEAEGANRPYDALAQALKNPLMDRGRLLHECDSVLVQVSGGPDMTLNEVQLLMEEFNRHVDERTRILFGATVAPELAGRLTATVISSMGAGESVELPVAPVTASSSPLRELAAREAQRLAAAAAVERPILPKTEIIRPETPAPEVGGSGVFYAAEAALEPAEAAVEPAAEPETDEASEWGSAAVVAASVQAAEELPEEEVAAAEMDDVTPEAPMDEVPEEPVAEPEPQPAKETRRRAFDERQSSLFGDEQKPRPLSSGRPGMDAAPTTRIAKPIPGRTLQSGVARMPVRRTEPPAQPEPTPQPQPKPKFEPEPTPVHAQVEVPEVVPEPMPEPEPVEDLQPESASPGIIDSQRPDDSEPAESVAPLPPAPVPARPAAAPARPVPGAASTPRTPPQRLPVPPVPSGAPNPAKGPLQETLQFEPVSRGRFDKGEPTIVDGQDLDVPTFLRRNVRVR